MPAIPGEAQRHQNGAVHHNIRLIMKHICPHRLALGFSHHPALEGHQRQRAEQGDQRDDDTNASGLQRLRTHQVLNAGEKQKQRRAGDKHALRQRRQRFRFAMAKGMFFISRLQRIANHQQVGQRGGNIHQRIHQRSQNTD